MVLGGTCLSQWLCSTPQQSRKRVKSTCLRLRENTQWAFRSREKVGHSQQFLQGGQKSILRVSERKATGRHSGLTDLHKPPICLMFSHHSSSGFLQPHPVLHLEPFPHAWNSACLIPRGEPFILRLEDESWWQQLIRVQCQAGLRSAPARLQRLEFPGERGCFKMLRSCLGWLRKSLASDLAGTCLQVLPSRACTLTMNKRL